MFFLTMKLRNCNKVLLKCLDRYLERSKKGNKAHATYKELKAYDALLKYKPNSYIFHILHKSNNGKNICMFIS